MQTIDEASYVGNIFFLQMKGGQKVTAPDSVVPVAICMVFTISPWGWNIFGEIWQERKVKAKGENDTLAKTQRSLELSLGPRTAFNQSPLKEGFIGLENQFKKMLIPTFLEWMRHHQMTEPSVSFFMAPQVYE